MKRRIIGVTVGTTLPKPDLRQNDPTKGDFVKGKGELIAQLLPGGKTGQYLRKVSDEDGDVEWADLEIPKEYGLITYDQDKTITIT